MEQDGIRKNEILNLLQSYAEQTFQTSCEFLQEKIEYNGAEIWAELKACIHKLLLQTGEAQAERGKEQIQYLAFSFLRHSIYFNKLEYRIDVLDNRFYLDEQGLTEYYCPTFLQGRYVEDLEFLSKKAFEKLVRVQTYEITEIKQKYTALYDSIVMQMIENLTGLIMDEITGNGIVITKRFKIIYGEYMDRAVILYDREESERK